MTRPNVLAALFTSLPNCESECESQWEIKITFKGGKVIASLSDEYSDWCGEGKTLKQAIVRALDHGVKDCKQGHFDCEYDRKDCLRSLYKARRIAKALSY